MSKIIEDIKSFLGETKEIMSTAVPTVNNLITGVGMLNSFTGIISDTQESSVEEFNKLKAKYNQSSNEYIIKHLMQQNKLILNIEAEKDPVLKALHDETKTAGDSPGEIRKLLNKMIRYEAQPIKTKKCAFHVSADDEDLYKELLGHGSSPRSLALIYGNNYIQFINDLSVKVNSMCALTAIESIYANTTLTSFKTFEDTKRGIFAINKAYMKNPATFGKHPEQTLVAAFISQVKWTPLVHEFDNPDLKHPLMAMTIPALKAFIMEQGDAIIKFQELASGRYSHLVPHVIANLAGNSHRSSMWKNRLSEKACRNFKLTGKCSYGQLCIFSHDISTHRMKQKLQEVDVVVPIADTRKDDARNARIAKLESLVANLVEVRKLENCVKDTPQVIPTSFHAVLHMKESGVSHDKEAYPPIAPKSSVLTEPLHANVVKTVNSIPNQTITDRMSLNALLIDHWLCKSCLSSNLLDNLKCVTCGYDKTKAAYSMSTSLEIDSYSDSCSDSNSDSDNDGDYDSNPTIRDTSYKDIFTKYCFQCNDIEYPGPSFSTSKVHIRESHTDTKDKLVNIKNLLAKSATHVATNISRVGTQYRIAT